MRDVEPFTRDNPEGPLAGERFLALGHPASMTIELVELAASVQGQPTRWLVKASGGSRWTLRLRDGSNDGLWYAGTPLAVPAV